NHAPHTERNVCGFAKARLSQLSVGQMHRTQRHMYGRVSLPRTGEGEDLFPQLASAQRMRRRSGARLNPHLNPLPLPKAEANFMRILTSCGGRQAQILRTLVYSEQRNSDSQT